MSSTADRALEAAVQQLAGTFKKDIVGIQLCTVNKVNTDYTIDCTPIGGDSTTLIPKVKLNAENNDGFVVIPAVNSTVLICTSTRNNYYVMMYSDVDKVVCIIDKSNSYEFSKQGFIWNDGTKGGLVNIYDLKQQIDTQLTAIKTAVSAGFAAVDTALNALVPGSGVSSAAFNSSATSILPINLTTLEDKKIKH